jgi:probable rRNA maturation factor
MLKLDVLTDDKRWNAPWKKDAAFFKKLIVATLKKAKASTNTSISLLLTDDASIQVLNKKYRKKNKPTNVLSFPMDEDGVLGDIVLALETIKAEAKAEKKTIRDHTAHLLVHGTLHLLGYDHMNDKDAVAMEKMEVAILETAKIADPYR